MLFGYAKAKQEPIWIGIDVTDWRKIGRYKWRLSSKGYAERYGGKPRLGGQNPGRSTGLPILSSILQPLRSSHFVERTIVHEVP